MLRLLINSKVMHYKISGDKKSIKNAYYAYSCYGETYQKQQLNYNVTIMVLMLL